MKIIQICLCGSYNPKLGYQDNILPKYYVKMGLECITIAPEYYRDNGEIVRSTARRTVLENGSTLIRIPNLFNLPYSINKFLRIYSNLYTILEEEKPDIIFLHNFQFLSYGAVIKYCKQNPNVVLYADSHTDYVNSARNWISLNILHKLVWRYSTKKLEPYVKKFWGVTEQRCRFMEEVYQVPREKVDLLVMGADVEDPYYDDKEKIRNNVRKTLGVSQDDFLIVSGGKIDKLKNIHLLVKALKKIENQHIKLVIFGSYNSEMEYLLKEIEEDNRIIYIGWINSEKVYDYFIAADLGVFPGTHSVLWEQAVGSGLPCIFKKWDGMTHVDVGGNCIFVSKDDVDELSECIKKGMDHDIYNKLYSVAQSKGIREFSYYDIAQKSIELFVKERNLERLV